MNEKQSIYDHKSIIFILILSSIALHIIIALIIMTYKMDLLMPEQTSHITKQDNFVLWQQQPQNSTHTPPPPSKPEQKKEEPKALKKEPKTITKEPKPAPEEKSQEFDPNKLPIIIAGKEGIDEQNLDGIIHNQQHKKSDASDVAEKLIEQQNRSDQKPILRSTPSTPFVHNKNSHTIFVRQIPQVDIQAEHADKYEYVPAVKEKKSIKTISFKNIGLGNNSNADNFGNSSNLSIYGFSPDIPTGDEQKYVTYLKQMADLLVTSFEANSQKNLIRQTPTEQVVFYIHVDRNGKLLETRIVHPSKHEVVNQYVLESVRQVGLFNQLPAFIKKETFRFNWRCYPQSFAW